MKKFRLFTLLAILATFSTVFAAWNYYNYADQFVSTPLKITVANFGSGSAVEKTPIDVSATSASPITISHVQSTENPYLLEGVASGDVTVTVTENDTGAATEYDYSFAVYSEDSSGAIELEADAVKTEITVVDGTATISAEAIADYFDVNLGECDTFDEFKYAIDNANSAFTASSRNGIYLKVYATKKTA